MEQQVIHIPKVVSLNKKRVCAYARISSKSDEQENSLLNQIEHYTKMIMMNPTYEFAGVFVDEGITGTSIYKRKEFQRMVDKALSGQIDLIITKSVSRFARKATDAIGILRVLKENNVEVYFETENISSFNSDMEMIFNIQSGVAEEASRLISENVRQSYARNFKNRKAYFNPELLYGYHKGKDSPIEIDEKEAEAVRISFNV